MAAVHGEEAMVAGHSLVAALLTLAAAPAVSRRRGSTSSPVSR